MKTYAMQSAPLNDDRSCSDTDAHGCLQSPLPFSLPNSRSNPKSDPNPYPIPTPDPDPPDLSMILLPIPIPGPLPDHLPTTHTGLPPHNEHDAVQSSIIKYTN